MIVYLFVCFPFLGGAFRFYSRDFSEHADLSRVETIDSKTAQAPFSETAWKCSRDTGSLRRA